MSSTTTPNPDPKSLETRFGLVMYGGVSLAIYINGVAQEFFNAVRGRGVYKFVKALTDTDIVVDIVSGTSAGGINGIMLAYALCNEKEFSDTASLWRNDGDIRRLLRSPGERVESGWSLLNSEGFYQPQLEAAFRDMRSIADNKDEDVSHYAELDLFVTGTDVDGNRSTQFDDAGHPIDVKDHRSVFHLKHRKGRKQPFDPHFRRPQDSSAPNREVTYKALAKLSRITSCFPAAFSPVTVAGVDENEDSPDGKLQKWGMLGKESCFLDGGLIDNKPFTHTLREIFFRSAVRKVDRKLFYVEPDPEHWEKLESATQPNFFQAVIASLIGIPGYESISDDLKLLGNHNSRLQRYKRVVSYFDDMPNGVEQPTPQVEALYMRSRLISLSEWIVHSVLKIEGRFELLEPKKREKAAELIKKFDEIILKEADANEAKASGPLADAASNVAPISGDMKKSVVEAANVANIGLDVASVAAHGNLPENGAGGCAKRDYLKEEFPAYFKRLMEAVGEKAGDEEKLAITKEFFEKWEKSNYGVQTSSRAETILSNYDVDFRLRRIFRTIYFTMKVLGNNEASVLVCPEDDEKKIEDICENSVLDDTSRENTRKESARALQYKRLLKALNDQVALHDIIRNAMEKVIDGSKFDWEETKEGKEGEVWKRAEAALKCLLDVRTTAAQELFAAIPEDKPEEWLSDEKLKGFNQKMRALASNIAEVTTNKVELEGIGYDSSKLCVTAPEDFSSLLVKIEQLERALVERLLPEGDVVRRAYEDFRALDAKLFPVELIAELHEKDIIKTYRISPFDARRGFSNKGLSDKVSGDALYHFGGFFKRSWRSNDILWGRLDSMCQLTETLLDPERLEEVLKNPYLRRTVRRRFYKHDEQGNLIDENGELLFDENGDLISGKEMKGVLKDALAPSKLFPHAGAVIHKELKKFLDYLLLEKYDDSHESKQKLEKKIAELCENLIEAAQFEALVEDLPTVIEDSLGEQVNWNQFRISTGKFEELTDSGLGTPVNENHPDLFKSPIADVDPFYGVVAAAGQTMKWMKQMMDETADGSASTQIAEGAAVGAASGALQNGTALTKTERREKMQKPVDTKLGKFFREDYKVGTEQLLKDMPPLVLLEIVSVSLLVLRNCVLAVFDKGNADTIRRHPLYIVIIEAPLRTFNLLIRFLRRAPRWEKLILIGASVVSAIVLILSIWGREKFLKSGDDFNLLNFGLLIVLPSLIIYGSYLYLRRETGKKKGIFWSALRLLATGINAVVGLAPLLVFSLAIWLYLAKTNKLIFGDKTVTLDHLDLLMIMTVALGLAIVGPYISSYSAPGLIRKTWQRLFRRWKIWRLPNKLQVLLENYFSVEDIKRVGQRLVATHPLVWNEVHDNLKKSAKDDADKLKKIAELDMKFGSYKHVHWGSLRGRLEELGLMNELWMLADDCKIPHEDDDWPLLFESVRHKLGNLASFDEEFKGRQEIKWGEARKFLEGEKRTDLLEVLRANLDELLIEELKGNTDKERRDKKIARRWPYVADKIPKPGTVARWMLLDRVGKPLTLKAYQRRTLARKIIDRADEIGTLTKLPDHMRFVNPEALYGE